MLLTDPIYISLVVNPDTGDEYPPEPDFGWITIGKAFRDLSTRSLFIGPKTPKQAILGKNDSLSETNERAPISSLGIASSRAKGTRDLSSIMGNKAFELSKTCISDEDPDRCVLSSKQGVDRLFFRSGTTGQAVIELNREVEERQYILVEMSDYFETILKPRILKVIYSANWEDGKPISRKGISQMLQVYPVSNLTKMLSTILNLNAPISKDYSLDRRRSAGAVSPLLHARRGEPGQPIAS